MKLTDAQNGKTVEFKLIRVNDEYLGDREVTTIFGDDISLATLNKYFVDYKPNVPMIEDEELRKAIRLFAKTCKVKSLGFDYINGGVLLRTVNGDSIFFKVPYTDDLKQISATYHSVNLLCGKEKQ